MRYFSGGQSFSTAVCSVFITTVNSLEKSVKVRYELDKKKGKANHLLFMDYLKLYRKTEKECNLLVNTVRIFSEEIRMEFGISNCVLLVMK